MSRVRVTGLRVWLSGACLLAAGGTAAAADPGAAAGADEHAHHQRSEAADVKRTEAQYVIPEVSLVRADGKTVALPAELDDGRPVVLNFIYTSCTTICPLSSQVFEQFQENLGDGRGTVHMVSISIDPEQDTPARLRAYAAQFHAAKGWDHYSGSVAAVVKVQKAFNAYLGDKMSHTPLTLMRAAPGKPWVRLDGFARSEDLLAERQSWASTRAALVTR